MNEYEKAMVLHLISITQKSTRNEKYTKVDKKRAMCIIKTLQLGDDCLYLMELEVKENEDE